MLGSNITIQKERDFKFSEYFVIVGLICICIILSIISPVFLTVDNVLNVLLQTSINSVIAIGMTMVILTSGIDLSVGSVVAVCGIFVGITFRGMGSDATFTMGAIVCILVGLLIGATAGALNGVLISKAKLPPFIATLGMMSTARGAALAFSNGKPISQMPNIVSFIGGGRVWVFYMPIIIMIVLYTVAWWMLRYTTYGRNIYAVGGNMEAAKLSGINVPKTLIFVYIISGICAGIAAVMLIGRLNSAQPTAGLNYELDAIAATVIGGTSMSGGEGKIIGTLIGAVFITVLRNGLNLLNVSSYIQQMVIGVVIILAVMLDTLRDRNKS